MILPEIEISIKFKGKTGVLKRYVKKSSDIYNIALEVFNADQIQWVEEFIMLSLNNAQEVIGFYKVSKGGTGVTIADPKIIATVALQSIASKVIIMHNHPSGSLKPSDADKQLTKKITDGLALLDIRLVDHLIVTTDGYYSFADEGIL